MAAFFDFLFGRKRLAPITTYELYTPSAQNPLPEKNHATQARLKRSA
jgi:hypothetical protein